MSQNTNLSLHPNNTKTLRNSNLELFRIIAMLLIIAHHYVVNSGLDFEISSDPKSTNSIFLCLFGMWGKIGINCYLLITGYFMCKSQITLKKFIKLWLEVVFYGLIFFVLFLISGHHVFTWKRLLYALFPINDVSNNFVGCFLLFYLFIPFLNILIQGMNKRKHLYLIILCLFIYTFLATFFVVTINYVIWFSIIYIIASYIRLYQIPYYKSVKFWGWAALFSVIISCLSILICIYFDKYPYKFVFDSNSIMAVITAICSFMFFKNVKVRYSKWINAMGASTFGVLLIHANCDTMREWLWVHTLKNTEIYHTNHLFIHAIISVVSIFIICSILDQIRLHYIENPLFKKIYPFIERLNFK